MNIKDINLENLNDMTLVQLKELGKELGIKSLSKYKKNELIEIISEKKSKDMIDNKKENEKEIKSEQKQILDKQKNKQENKTFENRNQTSKI